MTEEQRKRLRELAEKATSGPWEFIGVDYSQRIWCDEVTAGGKSLMGNECYYPWVPPVDDMQYIAAANPAAILELLDEVERLKREYEKDT
jgi:hypothetical protein